MNEKTKHVAVLIYNSYKDPLFQNLVFKYINYQAARRNIHFHLITFEQEEYALSASETEAEKERLKELSISWTPLKYHSGSFFMAKKSWDLYLAWRQCKKITRRHNVCGLLTFGNVAAAFGALLKPVFAAKLIIYGYEPHALFMVDMGAWKKGGLKSKALTRYERMAEKKSDFLLTGTSHYKKVLEDKGLQNVYRAPSSVDGNIFLFNHHSRSQIRNEFHLKGRKVLVYAGKFGGLYYHEGTAQFCAGLLKQDPSFFFLILTPHAKEEIASLFNDAGILGRDVHILKANNPEEVAHYFSAGDIGLNTIPPLPSQRYRSPIKVGEYLMCGLPFITCPGISEDDTYAVEHEVGLVVPELSFETGVATASRISDLLKEEKESLRNRCRNTGLIYRGDHIVNEIFSEIFDEI